MSVVELENPELPYEMKEELKLFRTNIQFCGIDKKVLLMTSAFTGEGKSTVTLNLARSLSELKKKVLLIDADMRKSVLRRKVAGNAPKSGLSHFLAGQKELEDVIFKTSIPNLSVIFSGIVPPNPTELLSTPRFGALIEAARKHYDYVLIDCPPVGMVIDAAIIAPHCDGITILLEAGSVKYRLAQDVVSKMRNTGTPILGVILNKVNRRTSSYYYKYYGRYYGKYYEYKAEE